MSQCSNLWNTPSNPINNTVVPLNYTASSFPNNNINLLLLLLIVIIIAVTIVVLMDDDLGNEYDSGSW